MSTKRFWTNRKRLILTLELAVMLPALALIVVNFYHLKSIDRDKVLEAAIHRDFQYMLAIAEKKLAERSFGMVEAVSKTFPSPDEAPAIKAKKLDDILCANPQFARVFVFDSKTGLTMRTQPGQMGDKVIREEHEEVSHSFTGWLRSEVKGMAESIRKKTRPVIWYGGMYKRGEKHVFMTTAFIVLPSTPERSVIAGATLDPAYLRQTFFPTVMNDLITYSKIKEGDRGNPLAMTIFPGEYDGSNNKKLLAMSEGWREAKPEVTRKLDDAFRGLSLGIQFQKVTVAEMSHRWVERSFLILGVLSLLLVGGLVLTYRSVSKEMALAKLKSDFVSNVSHELRTPLSLIRLYAETLELGRVQADKVAEYYRIIRKESERLTALINNILDFSRIEAGRKEYEFRETDIAELVRNTLESYRDQIEQQGFAFEQQIDPNLPIVRVDREAIARSVVNLVNNALKYSAQDKFLGVKVYRANGSVKLEVVDRGIGIARSEQSKIFEKFYRAGDPLVHNTKGSGLGLSLVRHIAHAHGGEVEVESTLGKGSKFTLRLPVAAGAQSGASAASSGAKAS